MIEIKGVMKQFGNHAVLEGCSMTVRKGTTYALRYLGSLIETPIFYEHLSARENLMLHLSYMDKSADIEKMLEMVGLIQINEKPVSTFSMGMRQRLAIARTLLHEPELLIMDEPFNGLDPLAADEMQMRIGILSNRKIQKEFVMNDYRDKKQEEFEQEVLRIMKGGAV